MCLMPEMVAIEFSLYHAPKCTDTLEQLLAKPIDVDKLVSLIRIWMPK